MCLVRWTQPAFVGNRIQLCIPDASYRFMSGPSPPGYGLIAAFLWIRITTCWQPSHRYCYWLSCVALNSHNLVYVYTELLQCSTRLYFGCTLEVSPYLVVLTMPVSGAWILTGLVLVNNVVFFQIITFLVAQYDSTLIVILLLNLMTHSQMNE